MSAVIAVAVSAAAVTSVMVIPPLTPHARMLAAGVASLHAVRNNISCILGAFRRGPEVNMPLRVRAVGSRLLTGRCAYLDCDMAVTLFGRLRALGVILDCSHITLLRHIAESGDGNFTAFGANDALDQLTGRGEIGICITLVSPRHD